MQLLKNLSNEQLESSMIRHVRAERKMLHLILEHIREIHRRDLHLIQYSTMKDYLIAKYGYSEPCARHRVAAAKLMSEVPAVAEMLQAGSLNLTKIGILNQAIQEKEAEVKQRLPASMKVELVEMISGKTGNESQKILACALDIPIKESSKMKIQKDNSVRTEFTMSERMKAKFDKARELLKHELSQELKAATIENILEAALDSLIESKGKEISSEKIQLAQEQDKEYSSITPKLRRLVIQRDQYCQHKDHDGNTCGSKDFLEADHIIPEWAGGKTKLSNLQTLCGSHNRYKYRQQVQQGFYGLYPSH